MVEDRAKMVSDLYGEKSKILKCLSDLSNPKYSFAIGYHVDWAMGMYSYNELETEFLKEVKEMTVAQYNKQLQVIEEKLNKVLTN